MLHGVVSLIPTYSDQQLVDILVASTTLPINQFLQIFQQLIDGYVDQAIFYKNFSNGLRHKVCFNKFKTLLHFVECNFYECAK